MASFTARVTSNALMAELIMVCAFEKKVLKKLERKRSKRYIIIYKYNVCEMYQRSMAARSKARLG
jgi:hypothetical protein